MQRFSESRGHRAEAKPCPGAMGCAVGRFAGEARFVAPHERAHARPPPCAAPLRIALRRWPAIIVQLKESILDTLHGVPDGNADSVGSDRHNSALSTRRAEAVSQKLSAQIPRVKAEVTTSASSERNHMKITGDNADQLYNRRTDIHLTCG